MIMVGCDFHTRFQQVAMLDPTTGEVIERRLNMRRVRRGGFTHHFANPLGWA